MKMIHGYYKRKIQKVKKIKKTHEIQYRKLSTIIALAYIFASIYSFILLVKTLSVWLKS
jgi:hypothetical protein